MADPRLGKPTYRSAATRAAYLANAEAGHLDGGCPLCERKDIDVVKEFTHWRLVLNKFPYDAITDTHHMLITREHIDEDDLTEGHKNELKELKKTYLNDHYNIIFETLPSAKSIPPHFHLHLIVVKNIAEC